MADNVRPDPHHDLGGEEVRSKHDDRSAAAAAAAGLVRSGHELDHEPPRAVGEIDSTSLRKRFGVKEDDR
jgi:hypothetical protein